MTPINLKHNTIKKTLSSEIKPPVTEEFLSFDSADFDFAEDILVADTTQIIEKVQNLSPKDTLISFLRESTMDVDYVFNYDGTYEQAAAFRQRMRVQLSRFRTAITKLNKPLNHFYVLTKSIEVKSDNLCTITLIKSKQRKKKLESNTDLVDVLDFLTL